MPAPLSVPFPYKFIILPHKWAKTAFLSQQSASNVDVLVQKGHLLIFSSSLEKGKQQSWPMAPCYSADPLLCKHLKVQISAQAGRTLLIPQTREGSRGGIEEKGTRGYSEGRAPPPCPAV